MRIWMNPKFYGLAVVGWFVTFVVLALFARFLDAGELPHQESIFVAIGIQVLAVLAGISFACNRIESE